jgi:kinesin family protein C2/C3
MHIIVLESCSDTTVVVQRVACLLRKVVQEIERRISTQAEHLRTVITCLMDYFLDLIVFSLSHCVNCLMFLCLQQSNLFKTREEKYQSRIRLLETLASGTSEESQVW